MCLKFVSTEKCVIESTHYVVDGYSAFEICPIEKCLLSATHYVVDGSSAFETYLYREMGDGEGSDDLQVRQAVRTRCKRRVWSSSTNRKCLLATPLCS